MGWCVTWIHRWRYKTTTLGECFEFVQPNKRKKNQIGLQLREISIDSINQVNAVILLSFIAIGTSTLLLSYFEPNMLFRNLLFEVVSAYSTVGLSLGITASLSEPPRWYHSHHVFGSWVFLLFLIGLYRQFSKSTKETNITHQTISFINWSIYFQWNLIIMGLKFGSNLSKAPYQRRSWGVWCRQDMPKVENLKKSWPIR